VGGGDHEKKAIGRVMQARFNDHGGTATMYRYGLGAHCPRIGVADEVCTQLDGKGKRIVSVLAHFLRPVHAGEGCGGICQSNEGTGVKDAGELLQTRDKSHLCDGMCVTHLDQAYAKQIDKGIAYAFSGLGDEGFGDTVVVHTRSLCDDGEGDGMPVVYVIQVMAYHGVGTQGWRTVSRKTGEPYCFRTREAALEVMRTRFANLREDLHVRVQALHDNPEGHVATPVTGY
jgi:hypothetical protein